MRLDRPGNRERDTRQRCNVKHAIDAFEGGPYRLAVADVGLDQFGARVEVLAAAGRENIDDAHPETSREELIDEVGADEPGASGDQYGTGRAHTMRIALNCEVGGTGLNLVVLLKGFRNFDDDRF